MKPSDDMMCTITAIHAAGLDAAQWAHALDAITQMIGGVGTTLEVIDRTTFAHRQFFAFGIAPAGQLAYVEHYAAMNPRFPPALRQRPGEMSLDYDVIDERGIDRSPFYAEFLAPQDLRYVIGGILQTHKHEFGVVAIQRSPRQGHVGREEIALMRHLLPHVNQAYGVARRLASAEAARESLECALDRLADGVALIQADGTILYLNEALRAIARRADGLRLRDGCIELADAIAAANLGRAIGAVRRLQGGDIVAATARDFVVPRSGGLPAYLVSIRPILERERISHTAAIAIVFVRDPLVRNVVAVQMLRDIFGLTDAEAALAQALQAGMAPGDYAESRAVSLNTVYTHLRRIKEKTRCNRMAELIRKINDLDMPVCPD